MRIALSPSGGSVLVELVLALGILSMVTLGLVRTVADSRRASVVLAGRAALLSRQVRAVYGACRWPASAGLAEPLPPRHGLGGGLVETWHVRGGDETLVVMRFPPDSSRCAVCGRPGSKRWLP